jgi:hypothetical protein
MLKEQHNTSDMHEVVIEGLDRLKKIMRLICFERWDDEALHRNWHDDT